MALIVFRFDSQFQGVVGLTLIKTKDFIVTTQFISNDQMRIFTRSHGSIHYPFIEAMLKNPTKSYLEPKGKLWINLTELSLRRPSDDKDYSRVNLNCKWTPISLQEEHIIFNNFWIPGGTLFHSDFWLLRIYSV